MTSSAPQPRSSWSHGNNSSYGTFLRCFFTAKFTAMVTSQVLVTCKGLTSENWGFLCPTADAKWFRNNSGRSVADLVFTSFDVRFLFYFVWNLTFNNVNRMSKTWCLSTCGWLFFPKTDVVNFSICNWWSETVADGLRSIHFFLFVLPSFLWEYREQHV